MAGNDQVEGENEADAPVDPGDPASERTRSDGAATGGARHAVADRIDRWLVPVVRWVRRTMWVPIISGVSAGGLLVTAALVWQGREGDGLALAVGAVALMAVPVVGLGLFVRILGELTRLPATVRRAPERVGDLKGELGEARTEFADLRRKGILALPEGLRWLRRTLGRLDAIGVAGVAAALAALHPLRLLWIVVLCWLGLLALPVSIAALVLALRA